MTTDDTLDRVKDLLADGQTEAAADLLLDLAKTSHKEYFHTALLLKNRLETLQHRIIEGVISAPDERIEWARISRGVVDLVAQIDRGEAPKPAEEVLPPPPPIIKKPAKTGFPKLLLFSIPVLLVIGVFTVPKMMKKAPDKTNSSQPVQQNENGKTVEKVLISGQLVMGAEKKPVPNTTLIIGGLDEKIQITTDGQGRFKFPVSRAEIGKQATPIVIINGKRRPLDTKRLTPGAFETIAIRR